jgi:hypothetical protein
MKLIRDGIVKEQNANQIASELRFDMADRIPTSYNLKQLVVYLEDWWKSVGISRGFKSAYLQVEEAHLNFIVLNNKTEFNEDDENILTDLDVDIARNQLFKDKKLICMSSWCQMLVRIHWMDFYFQIEYK